MAFKHMKWLRIDFFSIPKEYSSITIRTEASEVDISILFNREQDVSMKFPSGSLPAKTCELCSLEISPYSMRNKTLHSIMS